MAYDVRGVANFVLDMGERQGIGVSNFAINKIVFFLHAHFLVEFNRPLVSAKIEAWQHGPVFRELFKEFKTHDSRPIASRAQRINPESGIREICRCEFTPEEAYFLERIAEKYLPLSFSALYAMSHEAGGPWSQVWNHDTLANASMKISDEIIKAWLEDTSRH